MLLYRYYHYYIILLIFFSCINIKILMIEYPSFLSLSHDQSDIYATHVPKFMTQNWYGSLKNFSHTRTLNNWPLWSSSFVVIKGLETIFCVSLLRVPHRWVIELALLLVLTLQRAYRKRRNHTWERQSDTWQNNFVNANFYSLSGQLFVVNLNSRKLLLLMN